jgi:hypothetical protein
MNDMTDDAGRAFLDGHPPADVSHVPAPMGRPSSFNQDIADKILDELARGSTLRSIQDMPGFPGRSTVFRWLAENEDFSRRYAVALAWRTEGRADEIVQIADDSSEDFVVGDDGEGGPMLKLDREHIARSKMRIEVRQWLMEREMPRKYSLAAVAAPAGATAKTPESAEPEPLTMPKIGPTGVPAIEADPITASLKAYEQEAGKAGLTIDLKPNKV